MSWLIITTAVPCRTSFCRMEANAALNCASKPFVGSSSRSTCGRSSKSLASAAFCISPPDRSNGWRAVSPLIWQRRTTDLIRSSLSSCGMPLFSKAWASVSHTVLPVKSACGSCGRVRMDPLLEITFPLYGFRLPLSSESSVLFPVPLPPMIVKSSPRLTSMLRLRRTSGAFFS